MTVEVVDSGCEGAVTALKGWIEALKHRDFDYLERVLAPEFQFTCSPEFIPGGRLGKADFIEMDKKIHDSEIKFLHLAAHRLDTTVITTVFAEVREDVRGDLGPGMPDAAKMTAMLSDHVFAYASAWRETAPDEWRCVSHNVMTTVR